MAPRQFVWALTVLCAVWSERARGMSLAQTPAAESGGSVGITTGVSLASACCARLASIGFASELPVVVLDAPPHSLIRKHVNEDVHVCTCSTANATWEDYDGAAVAGVRGSTSQFATKKRCRALQGWMCCRGSSTNWRSTRLWASIRLPRSAVGP